MQGRLEGDAAEWRSSFLGEDDKLQPKGRERGSEHAHPGDQATAVDSSGEHLMLDGIGHEALQRPTVDSEDSVGRGVAYCSPQLVVKLAKTQPYVPPVFEDMTSDTCLEVDVTEGVHICIAFHVPRTMRQSRRLPRRMRPR